MDKKKLEELLEFINSFDDIEEFIKLIQEFEKNMNDKKKHT
ncbi:hypothetical protein [Bacillus cereus]|nr:hypothetical protein [Bacillus cereus]